MRIFVVKYDDTQPYDPGTCLVLGAYSSRVLAESAIAAFVAETTPVRCLKSGVNWLKATETDYEIRHVPKYSQSEDVFEIVETELDETPKQTG